MTKAVYAGTFDMPTKGHESVIAYSASMVDELIVAIGVNPLKKTMFSLNQRLKMLVALARQYSNVTVDSFHTDQYLVNYAGDIGAQLIVRGLRNINDFINEQVMCEKNAIINPRIKTIFVMTDHKYSNVASSTVKMMMGPTGWEAAVRGDIPEPIWEMFLEMVQTNAVVSSR